MILSDPNPTTKLADLYESMKIDTLPDGYEITAVDAAGKQWCLLRIDAAVPADSALRAFAKIDSLKVAEKLFETFRKRYEFTCKILADCRGKRGEAKTLAAFFDGGQGFAFESSHWLYCTGMIQERIEELRKK